MILQRIEGQGCGGQRSAWPTFLPSLYGRKQVGGNRNAIALPPELSPIEDEGASTEDMEGDL
jgi:hypothetical protein